MANQEHLDILKQGVEVWNRWREAYPGIQPDLCEAHLNQFDLRRMYFTGPTIYDSRVRVINFSRSNLRQTNLTGADLAGANFSGANLSGSNLSRADLSEADLSEANLSNVYLSETNLTGANLSGTCFSNALLRLTIFGRTDLHISKRT